MTGPAVLWCGSSRGKHTGNGWSFPTAVDRHLRALTVGRSVFHPFGGRARFGLRGDIDPIVRPDVIADAWLPPFRRDAFDVVILDPPYPNFNLQMQRSLLRAAGYIARDHVVWFHTVWIRNTGRGRLELERSWLVRVGDSCACRCLQVFRVGPAAKEIPEAFFTRGPALKYNRWLAGQQGLGLEAAPS